jgi:hypothetical protein
MKTQKPISEWLYVGSLTIIICSFLYAGIIANGNLLSPQNIYIDESITFNGVKKILYPESLNEFIWAITDGDDHRYGRILWNSIAAAAYIPSIYFGDIGQLFAGRMLQVVLLISSFIIFAVTFIESRPLRIGLIFILSVMPFTTYFMTMPKPEPIMIFCLASFFYFCKKNNLQEARPYWILLGMAFGAKISILPAIPILLFAALYNKTLGRQPIETLRMLFITVAYIFIGFCLAIPMFIKASGIVIIQLGILYLIIRLGIKNKMLALGLALVTALCILAIPEIRNHLPKNLGIRYALEQWIHATFMKLNYGGLEPNYTWRDWSKFFITYWMMMPVSIAIAISCLIGSLATFIFTNLTIRWRQLDSSLLILGALLIIGCLMFISPFLSIKNRMWGMYLYPGSILIITSVFYAAELVRKKQFGTVFKEPLSTPLKYLSATTLIGLLVTAICFWAPHSIEDIQFLGTRNSIDDYRNWNYGK